jgi:hypothetical protein
MSSKSILALLQILIGFSCLYRMSDGGKLKLQKFIILKKNYHNSLVLNTFTVQQMTHITLLLLLDTITIHPYLFYDHFIITHYICSINLNPLW